MRARTFAVVVAAATASEDLACDRARPHERGATEARPPAELGPGAPSENGATEAKRASHADGDGREPSARAGSSAPSPDGGMITAGDGFPEAGPWVSFYGTASQMGDVARVASTFRIINLDADPGTGNFTDEQLRVLRAGGKNRVLGYLNVGACERFRTYWSSAPAGLLSCGANKAAQRGRYEGYPDETWMDPGDASYQRLILEHVAARLGPRVDGFYLDNLEILEHSAVTSNGPCSPGCRQGGLDLVRRLRERFPYHLIVMQNATSDVTRLGKTGGVAFPTLLDGVAHEEVYAPNEDSSAEEQLDAWRAMELVSGSGRVFWIAVEDYVGSCRNAAAARRAGARARKRGFSPYASDESGGQKVICFWD